MTDPQHQALRQKLDRRLSTLLPAQYQDSPETIQPTPMGSAPLAFHPDGTVAWDQIWTTFCDLAMAGGPPHRGTLLLPGTPAEIQAAPGRYNQVTTEICRGITLVTGLEAAPARTPGWIRVECPTSAMAGWLTRAITMENVSAACAGAVLYLPAAPTYRLEKEIKNVITVTAKTTHYWLQHTAPDRQKRIADLLHEMDQESPLLQPPLTPAPDPTTAEAIHQTIGLPTSTLYPGWLGIDYPTVPAALWLMQRALASNVLARREATTLFVPSDPRVIPLCTRLHRLAEDQQILSPKQ